MLYDRLTGIERRMIDWLLRHAKDTEWQTRHAGENRYCPYCTRESDSWEDQNEHDDGCQFVEMMDLAKRLLGNEE